MQKNEMFDLQLFADGGAASAAGGADGADAGVHTTAEAPLAKAKNKSGEDLSKVKYGKQIEAVEPDSQQQDDPVTTKQAVSQQDRAAAFENLIKGEYKDLYDQRVQDTIQKRFKNVKANEDRLSALSPVLEMLGQKYGVDAQDADALAKAIQDDDSYYEEEAMEKGVTVEQLKTFKRMERENSQLRQQIEAQQRQKSAEEVYSQWQEQAKEVAGLYKGFDLSAELQNPKFVKLMKVPGMDVRTAFEVAHKDELMPAAMQMTAKVVEQKLTNSIMAGRSRPQENGLSSGGGVVVKTDPEKLSSADLAEIRKRVLAGERITF